MKDLELLNSSQQYVGKKDLVFPAPIEITKKFGSVNIVKLSNPIKLAVDDQTYETYPQFILENKLHDNEVIEGFYGTVGILTNYKRNKFTIYSGATARACLNLSIFGANYVKEYDLLSQYEYIDNLVYEAQNSLLKQLDVIRENKERLEKNTYTQQQYDQRKGELIRYFYETNTTLVEYFNHSVKMDVVEDSIYLDMPLSDWRILSTMTDLIRDKSVNERISKTLELEELFV